jgi:hypothetical protein
MKKFAKMSLVAAVAVAGLSSTVAAKPLADAIQGTSVSGLVRYSVYLSLLFLNCSMYPHRGREERK